MNSWAERVKTGQFGWGMRTLILSVVTLLILFKPPQVIAAEAQENIASKQEYQIAHCCHAHSVYPYDRYCCHPPTYVAPSYGVGPASVRGVSRRTARRTSRRVGRR